MKRTIMFCYCLIGWIAVWSISSVRANENLPKMNGWYLPTGKWFDTSKDDEFFGFQEFNPNWVFADGTKGGWHLGVDIKKETKVGDPVYSLSQGEIIVSRKDVNGYGPNRTQGGAVLIKYQAVDGTVFVALYGHLDNPRPVGPIRAGDVVGNMNAWNPPHLHLGIFLNDKWPDKPGFEAYQGYEQVKGKLWNFLNPTDFLLTHTPQISPNPPDGNLTVLTEPTRAKVVVEGVGDGAPLVCFQEKTSPAVWNLPPGRYRVKFYQPWGWWLFPPDPQEVTVALGKETIVKANYNRGVAEWLMQELKARAAYPYRADTVIRLYNFLPIDHYVDEAAKNGVPLNSYDGEIRGILSNAIQDDPEAAARRREAIRQLYITHLLRVPSQAEIDGWFDFLV